MIKANELRIGNVITPLTGTDIRRPSGVPMVVLELHYPFLKALLAKQNAAEEENWLELKYFDVEPIPLTEEWLLKLGHNDENKFSFFGEFGLVQRDGRYYLSYSDKYATTLFQEIEHVHQLQNLYYALRGEELEVKP